MILWIIFGIVGAFIAYSLCESEQPIPLALLYFILGMVKQYLVTGTIDLLYYAVFYFIYSLILAYTALFAYKRSRSFLGFIIVVIALYLVVGLILSKILGVFISDHTFNLF